MIVHFVPFYDVDNLSVSAETSEQNSSVGKKIKAGKRSSRKNGTMDFSEEGDGKQKEGDLHDESEEMEDIVTERPKKRKTTKEDGVIRKKKKVREPEPVMDDIESGRKKEESKPVKKERTGENRKDNPVKRDIPIENEGTSEEEEEEKRPVKRNKPIEEEEKEKKKPVKRKKSTEEEEKEENSPDEKEEEEEEEKQPVKENPRKEEEDMKSIDRTKSDEEEETKPEKENTPIEEEEEEESEEEQTKETPISPQPEKRPPQGIPHRESLRIEEEEEEEAQEQSATEQPIFELLEVEMNVIGNRIAITPSFKTTSSMKMFCSVILTKERMPTTEGLMYRVTLLGQDLKDTKGHDTLYLVTADLQSVKGVGCIGYASPNIFFGPLEIPVVVEPPPAPDINTQIIEQTPLSLEVYVKSSMESRVWCKVLKEDVSDVSIDLIQTGSQRMVRRRASLYFKDLTPNTEYHIWCYAESKEGVPMKQSLEEVKLTTRTLECIISTISLN